jgi:hypothetical protein
VFSVKHTGQTFRGGMKTFPHVEHFVAVIFFSSRNETKNLVAVLPAHHEYGTLILLAYTIGSMPLN